MQEYDNQSSNQRDLPYRPFEACLLALENNNLKMSLNSLVIRYNPYLAA
jgi:hypothetical protein